MKLISKTNRNFSIAILIVLPIACILLFVSLNYFIADEVDEKLRVDQLRIREQLKRTPELISMAPIFEVEEVQQSTQVKVGIRDVRLYDPIEKEDEPFRELVSKHQINGKWYAVKVRHSTIEEEDFMLAIGATMAVMLLLVLVFLRYLNARFSLKIWRPFYANIEALKAYGFNEDAGIQLEDSNLDEFQDLKQSIIQLTDKLRGDYNALKEFTENASHEIQTPLSIVSMHLEEILQEEHSEATYKKLYACYQSVLRLSKMNDRLLVLTKLDNNQYNQRVEINFNALLEDKIQEFAPLFKECTLEVAIAEKGQFTHPMDAVLANMLLVNLLSNIVKHAVHGRPVQIEITDHSLELSNGFEGSIDETQLFKRFKKGNNAASSTGLGLAIVKRIVAGSDLHIQASTKNNLFTITIKKP